jgi:DNA-binding response OmpR family regulator
MPAASAASVQKPKAAVGVLLVSPFLPDRIALRNILGHSSWAIHEASTCCEALALARQHDCDVAICQRELPDGDWKALFEELGKLPVPPNLIVTSRLADDELWAEVLNLGGYDVLAQPFEPEEVYRAVSLGWLERRRRAQERQPAAAAGRLTGAA